MQEFSVVIVHTGIKIIQSQHLQVLHLQEDAETASHLNSAILQSMFLQIKLSSGLSHSNKLINS
jgi:hypothetical protein